MARALLWRIENRLRASARPPCTLPRNRLRVARRLALQSQGQSTTEHTAFLVEVAEVQSKRYEFRESTYPTGHALAARLNRVVVAMKQDVYFHTSSQTFPTKQEFGVTPS